MKKFSFKKFAAVTAAVMAISAFASVANAADYHREEDEEEEEKNTLVPVIVVPTSGPTTTTTPGSEGPGTPVGGETEGTSSASNNGGIKDIIYSQDVSRTKNVVRIPESGATITAAAMAKMARNGGLYYFKQPSGITSCINGDDIKTVKQLKIGAKITALPEQFAVKVEFYQSGDFGTLVTVGIPKRILGKAGVNVRGAMCAYVDDNGSVSNATDALTMTSSGNLALTVSHASFYLISSEYKTEDITAGAGVDGDGEVL